MLRPLRGFEPVDGVAALVETTVARSVVHQEHVVPVRVLIDRMLAGDDPAEVLDVAVVAHVLASEHATNGPLVTNHAMLYSQMLGAELWALPDLGPYQSGT